MKRILNIALAATIAILNIISVSAAQTFTGDGTASVPIRVVVEGTPVYLIESSSSGIMVSEDDNTIVRDEMANDNDQNDAQALINAGKDAYIRGVVIATDLSEEEIEVVYNNEAYKRCFDGYQYGGVDGSEITWWAKELSLSVNVSSDRAGYYDATIPRSITSLNNPITVTIRNPFGHYDHSKNYVKSAKIVYIYENNPYTIEIDLDKDYNKAKDELTVCLDRFSQYFILGELDSTLNMQAYDVGFYIDGNLFDYSVTRPLYKDFDHSNYDDIPETVIRNNPQRQPLKSDDAENFYDFTGWKCMVNPIEALDRYEDAGRPDGEFPLVKYEATWDLLPKIYITWLNADGSKIDRKSYRKNTRFEVHDNPLPPNNSEYSAEFLGWRSSLDNKLYSLEDLRANNIATTNTTFTAEFRRYDFRTYIYKDYDGKVLSKQRVKDGQKPVPPADPARPDEADVSYEFIGWDVEGISGDTITFVAQYHTENKYLITFVDWNGSILKQARYKVGEMPTCPSPSRSGYRFIGWDKKGISPVSCSITYTAQYEKTEKKHSESENSNSSSESSSDNSSSGGGGGIWVNVMFRSWDGTAIKQVTVPQYTKLDPPVVSPFELNGYRFDFLGWIPGQLDTPEWTGYAPKDNATYKATFFATPLGKTGTTTQVTEKSATKNTTSGTAGESKTAKTQKNTSSSTKAPETTEKAGKTDNDTVFTKEWFEHTRAAQDAARIRFIPNEYYGNVTDYAVFAEAISKKEREKAEKIVDENKREQAQKIENRVPITQATDIGDKQIQPVKEEPSVSWWSWWYLLALIPIIAIIVAFIVFISGKKKSDEYEEY